MIDIEFPLYKKYQVGQHKENARQVYPSVLDEVVPQRHDGEEVRDGGQEGEVDYDAEMVDRHRTVFDHGRDLDSEAGQKLGVGQRKKVLA